MSQGVHLQNLHIVQISRSTHAKFIFSSSKSAQMGKQKELAQEDRGRILAYRDSGLSLRQIAPKIPCSKCAVIYSLTQQKWKTTCNNCCSRQIHPCCNLLSSGS